MCFVSAVLCFGRFFGNELAVTVNLGNVNFPGLKLAPLVTKLLSVFPSTCSPEVRPAARNFHLLTQGWHSQSRAVPAPSQSSAGAGSQCPVPATSQSQGGCSQGPGPGKDTETMLKCWGMNVFSGNYCITARTQRWGSWLFLQESSLEFIKHAWLAGLGIPWVYEPGKAGRMGLGTSHGVESLPTCPL